MNRHQAILIEAQAATITGWPYAQSLTPPTLALRLTALSQWQVHQGFADPASADRAQDPGRSLPPFYIVSNDSAVQNCN